MNSKPIALLSVLIFLFSITSASAVDFTKPWHNISQLNVNADLNMNARSITNVGRLQVAGDGSPYNIALAVTGRMQTGSANNDGGIWLSNAQNVFVGQTGNDVGFYTNSAGWAFLVKQNGNVGIGTASPGEKLDVNGIIHAGGIYFGNSGASTTMGISNDFGGNTFLTLSEGSSGMRVVNAGNSAEHIRITSAGNVGMSGSLNIAGSLSVATINGGIPITSVNIASQSVNYANSAGSATRATYLGSSNSVTADGNGVLSATGVSTSGIVRGATVGTGDAFQIGNDAKLVDIDVSHTMGVYSTTDSSKGDIRFGTGSNYALKYGASNKKLVTICSNTPAAGSYSVNVNTLGLSSVDSAVCSSRHGDTNHQVNCNFDNTAVRVYSWDNQNVATGPISFCLMAIGNPA